MNLPISTIIALLSYAVALCGIVPLFPWLEPVPRLAVAVGLIAGVWQDRRGAWAIRNWALNAAVIPFFLYYALQFSRANPLQPVVSVLAVMLAVRLGGEKSGRHYLQIHVLALFCLAASSLYDLSPIFLVYLALMLLLVAVCLVLLTFHAQDSRMTLSRADLRKVLAAGLLMPLASLPLLLIFFPLLPRTPIPIWNLLPPPAAGVTSFSDKVEPGRTEEVAESRRIAFRAEMPRLPQARIYWRGTVFNRIEGSRWLRDPAPPPERTVYKGPRIIQTIYPEPGPGRTLIALDAPAEIGLRLARRSTDGVYELFGTAARRLTYRAESVVSGVLTAAKVSDLAFYLRIPDAMPLRIRRLAEDIRRHGATDERRVELLEDHFRRGRYRYAMQGLPTGADALERFLFEKRQGNCEFFASAFALLLRGAGVPARLAGGYLGGEYNDLGGYYLVGEEMAHVWVEAFIAGKGWVRIDPSSLAENAGAVWSGPRKLGPMDRFRLVMDSLDHSWNSSVITYDFQRQVEAMRSAGKRLQGFKPGKSLQGALPVVLALAGIFAALLLIARRGRLFPSREERILGAFHRRIERDCGIRPQRGRQGLFELAAASGSNKVRAFADIYAGAVYRDRRLSREEYRQLQRMLREGF